MKVNQIVLNQPCLLLKNNPQEISNSNKNVNFTGLNSFILDSKFVHRHIGKFEWGSIAAMLGTVTGSIVEILNGGTVNQIIGAGFLGLSFYLFYLAHQFGQIRLYGHP